MNMARWMALAAAVILGLAAWMRWDLRRQTAASTAVDEGAPALVDRPLPVTHGLGGWRPNPGPAAPWTQTATPDAPRPGPAGVAAAPRADSTAALSGSEAANGPPRPGEFDICGVGRLPGDVEALAPMVPGSEGAAPVTHAPPRAVVEDGLDALWEALRLQLRSAGPREQAIAWLMQGGSGSGVPGPAAEHWIVERHLAATALDTTDPVVIQWALRSCRRAGNVACWGVSARHWVHAEPGNVVAWAWLAQDEPGSLAEAIHGMTLAQYSDLRTDVIAPRIEAALPPGTSPHLRMSVLMRAQQVEAEMPYAEFKALFAHCHPEVKADANRRQQCDAIARVMTGHGRDLLSMMLGRRMAERAGWPAPRLAQLNDDIRSLQMLASAESSFNPAQPYSCASVDSTQRWLRGVGALGEVAWLRQRRGSGP